MGQRPTAMLFHDHFYGFRDHYTGDELVPAAEIHWTEWDYALADATRFIQDHTNQHGHLVWEYEDRENVEVLVEKKVDRHDALVEKRTGGKKYKKTPGEYFVSRLKLMPWAEKWPTVSDWYKSQETLTED